MDDIPEVSPNELASGPDATTQSIPEVDAASIATSIPEVSPDDLAPVAAKEPVPTTALGEDLRRTKAWIGKTAQTGKEVTHTTPEEETQAAKDAFQRTAYGSPLTSAVALGGWALNQAQQHVGRHIAAGALKLGMRGAGNITDTYNLLPKELGQLPGNVDTGNNPEQADFQARWERDIAQGGTALHDVRPTDSYKAGQREYILRELLSTIGGNGFRLTADEALPALNDMTQSSVDVPGFGKIPMSAIIGSVAHEVGGLPLFMFGTGIGSRVVAGERAALATGELLAPKELAIAVGKIQAKEAAIEGGVQGALQDAKDGNTNGQGMLAGAFMGGVLGKLGASVGGKSEVLAGHNAERAGLGLPSVTAKEFFKDAAAAAKPLSAIKRPAKVDTSSLYPTDGTVASEVRPLVSAPKIEGDVETPFSFRTVTIDQNGNTYLQHIALNKNGTSKETYRAPITDKHIADFKENGLPILTDRAAYGAILGKMQGQFKPLPVNRAFEEMINEHLIAMGEKPNDLVPKTGPQIIENLLPNNIEPIEPTRFEKKSGSSPRDNELTKAMKPVILTEGPGNLVHVTPVVDGALDTTVISTPKAKEGDIVHLPGNEPVVVEKASGPTLNVRHRDGRVSDVSAHDVAPVSEPELDTSVFKFNPTAVNKAHLKRFTTPAKAGEGELLTLRKLTVPRVMKATGMDSPAEAAALLQKMASDGKVAHDGNGNFYVHKSYQPELPNVKGQGLEVYYDVGGPNNRGKTGILRGRDPQKKGNYLLEVGDDSSLTPVVDLATGVRQGPHTAEQYSKAAKVGVEAGDVYPKSTTVSVPSEQVRTMMPVLLGDKTGSTLPQRLGVQTPLPHGIVITNQRIVAEVQEATRLNGALSKILSTPQNIKTGLQRFFSHDAMRVPTDIRSQAQTLAAQPGVVKANTLAYQQTLETQMGGLMSDADRQLNAVVHLNAARRGGAPSPRELAMVKFFKANPQLHTEVQATVKIALSRLKANSEFLAKAGFGNVAELEALRRAGVEEEYIANTYMKYMLQRKEWASFVQKQLPDVWNAAVSRMAERHPGKDSQFLEKEMLDVMGMDIQDAYKQMRTSPNGDVAKHLKSRIEMHDEIKAILGKADSASIQIAHSLAATDSLVARVNTWGDIQKTNYWSPGPRKDLGPHLGAHVPDLPVFGAARNGYVHESLRFLVEQKEPMAESRGFLRALSKYWKFNVVPAGGAAPWVSNHVRNWKGMVISGGYQSAADLSTFFDAADIMLTYRDNSILAGSNSLYTEAVNNGTITGGFVGSEINKNRAANRVLSAIKKQQGKAASPWDIIAELPKDMVGTAQDIGSAYDTIDRWYKFTAYLNIRRNAIANGMSVNDAAAFANMRVKQSFPDYEMVSPVIEKLRQGSIAGIAPFLSSKAEDMRINATTLARFASEPDLVGRVIGSALVFGGVKMLNGEIRKANGISDEQVQKALVADKLSSQTFRTASDIGPEYDQNGNLTKWDFTTYEDMLMTLQGNTLDNPLASALRNTVTGYVGENTLPGQGVDWLANQATGIRPLQANNPPTWRPGENGIINTMAYIAAHGGIPQAPIRLNDIQQRQLGTGNPITDAQHPKWTPNEVLVKSLGLPFADPVGKETDVGRAMEAGKTIKDVASQIPSAILNNKSDPQHADFLLQQKIQALHQVLDEFNSSKGNK